MKLPGTGERKTLPRFHPINKGLAKGKATAPGQQRKYLNQSGNQTQQALQDRLGGGEDLNKQVAKNKMEVKSMTPGARGTLGKKVMRNGGLRSRMKQMVEKRLSSMGG